jgi:hypothetical protein
MYKYHQKAYYHEKGKWKHREPERVDLFLTFCPCVNTFFMCVLFLIVGNPIKIEKKKIDFFKPKGYKK